MYDNIKDIQVLIQQILEDLGILHCVRKKQDIECMADPYNEHDKSLKVKVVKFPW